MFIRRVESKDLHELAQLFEEYRNFYGQHPDYEKAKEFFAQRMQRGESEIFVAVSFSGEFAGFVQLYPLFSSTRMRKLWLLNDLYVAPGFRGNGISKKLIERAKELCKETNSAGFFLETAMSNEIANSLYQSAGLQLDVHHNYYTWDNE